VSGLVATVGIRRIVTAERHVAGDVRPDEHGRLVPDRPVVIASLFVPREL